MARLKSGQYTLFLIDILPLNERQNVSKMHGGGATSNTLESAFEDTKQYVLTGLGSQFVHYTMTELVKRLDSGTTAGE
jgi:hypothetical protein